MDEIVGAPDVLAWGGEVRILPLVAGQSTTGVIARIAERRG
jgi:bifunctional ADP-heptose synthase (sugar kinase/adenylyltransferase)